MTASANEGPRFKFTSEEIIKYLAAVCDALAAAEKELREDKNVSRAAADDAARQLAFYRMLERRIPSVVDGVRLTIDELRALEEDSGMDIPIATVLCSNAGESK